MAYLLIMPSALAEATYVCYVVLAGVTTVIMEPSASSDLICVLLPLNKQTSDYLSGMMATWDTGTNMPFVLGQFSCEVPLQRHCNLLR